MDSDLIQKVNAEIEALPDCLGPNKKEVFSFLEKLIRLGSQLDYLFPLGEVENPTYEIHENLLGVYNLWNLELVATFLASNFSTENNIRTKYPVLIENDGVHNLLAPFTQPELLREEFKTPITVSIDGVPRQSKSGYSALTLNQSRYPDTNKKTGLPMPSKEGLKQFKQAHFYLKKRIEALAEIYKNKIEETNDQDKKNSKAREEIKLKTYPKKGIGYLFFHNEHIPIGESSSGKFKLIETLGNESFGKLKTIDTVFNIIKVEKDKNKVDVYLNSEFHKPRRKLELMLTQIKEINRAITKHVKDNKIKDFKFRLSLKSENNQNVWLEEKVGRGG